MFVSNITPPQVWAASSRSLTNFGSGALAPTSTTQATLAANTTVDLRPSAGTVANTTIQVVTGATATAASTIGMRDGVNASGIVSTAAAANAFTGFTGFNTSSVGLQIFNGDAAVAAKYMIAQFTYTI